MTSTYSNKEDIPSPLCDEVTEVDDRYAASDVSAKDKQPNDVHDDTNTKESDIVSAERIPSVQNQIETSSDSEANVVILRRDRVDKKLYPLKQPVGITR